MSELEKKMDLALEKIIWAIDHITDEEQKYMFLDTKAELLWKMGRVDEAISEIEKCVTYKPEDTYYNEQLEQLELVPYIHHDAQKFLLIQRFQVICFQ